MKKYKMSVTLEFETSVELPKVTMEGGLSLLERALEGLPAPEDIDEDKAHVVFSLQPI